MRSVTNALPDRVTATLADDDAGDGSRIYRLLDARGYTHRAATIRIRPFRDYGNADRYRIDTHAADGWHDLTEGNQDSAGMVGTYAPALRRAVSILFGLEDHG